MKPFPAILASFAMTAIIALGMLLIGGNALFNPNAGPVSNSPQQAAQVSAASVSPVSAQVGQNQTDQQQIAQLQSLVKQYQAREKQYQTELDQAATRLNQANQQLTQSNQQLQSYQNILAQLQQIGLIQVDQNGQITVNGFGGRGGNRSFFGGDD